MRIAVIGLGYVGMPLAAALARSFDVLGFDVDAGRIEELRNGFDRTGELDLQGLKNSRLRLTTAEGDMKGYDVYIITVPTPVDAANRPDLAAVRNASQTV